jgi:hypothetical protein
MCKLWYGAEDMIIHFGKALDKKKDLYFKSEVEVHVNDTLDVSRDALLEASDYLKRLHNLASTKRSKK